MRWDLAVFDLDGTLVNTLEDLKDALNYGLAVRGFPLHSAAACRKFVGNGVRNLVRMAIPEYYRDDSEMFEDCFRAFMDYYLRNIAVCSRPYDGMPQLLRRLSDSGMKLAVASNKFQEGAEQLMAKFYPDIRFEMILGASDNMPGKPSPEVMAAILAKTGVTAGRTVMIGDSATDIRTAANGGVESVAVTWGFRSGEELSDAGYIVDSPAELEKIVIFA